MIGLSLPRIQSLEDGNLELSRALSSFHGETSVPHGRFETDLHTKGTSCHLYFKEADSHRPRGLWALPFI